MKRRRVLREFHVKGYERIREYYVNEKRVEELREKIGGLGVTRVTQKLQEL